MHKRVVFPVLIIAAMAAIAFGNEKFKENETDDWGNSTPRARTQTQVPARRTSYHYRSTSYGPGIEPTHYFYVPTSDVLRNREFILSFHEWALGIDNNLHVFISPFSSISGIFLGLKYGYSGDWAVGGGLATDRHWGRYYVVEPDYYVYDQRTGRYYYVDAVYEYYYDYDRGLGLGGFITKSIGPLAHLAGSLRIWEDFVAMDIGIGGKKDLGRYTSLIFELQGGLETYSFDQAYLGLDGAMGIRYTVPSLPPLKISAGLALGSVFPAEGLDVWPYIDLSYGTRF